MCSGSVLASLALAALGDATVSEAHPRTTKGSLIV
jgi:hypothetical protein